MKVQKYKKYISTKVLITQSVLELQTPYFAWKFIWTVQPNDKLQKSTKKKKTKNDSGASYQYKKVKLSKNAKDQKMKK